MLGLDILLQDPAISSISIMTDPDLHPLPITPNDPLSIVSIVDILFV